MKNPDARAATLAALDVMRRCQLPGVPIAQWDHPKPAVLFWREFVAAGGVRLDPQIWRQEPGPVQGFAQAVETALTNGWASSKACTVFLYETPDRHDWLIVGDGNELGGHIADLFSEAITRSHLAVQVLQGVARPSELERLDA